MERQDLDNLKAAVEALLFAASAPLSIRRICEILGLADRARVKQALSFLADDMARPSRGVELVEVAGGWRMQTRPDFAQILMKLRQGSPARRLSQAAMETLAVIAYRQPVTRAEIEQARGVDSIGTIRNLIDRKLVRIAGRKNIPGNPLLYRTTRHFLEVFQLKHIGDLPSYEELNPSGSERQAALFSIDTGK